MPQARPCAPFREAFDANLPFVCRALRRLGVHQADLADVAQDLFLAVHARWAHYDPDRPLRTWLYSYCLRYAANDRRLARHRDEELGGRELLARPSPDVAARDLILRALDRLDEERREAFVLHDMEGLSAPEIAELTATPLNTVYSRLRLARQDLRAALVDLGEVEHG